MTHTVLVYLLVLLIISFFSGALFKRLKQPPVVGYLLAGFLLNFLLQNQTSHEVIDFLSELGIVLMLFTLGIEFSFRKLSKVLVIAVGGGIVQILATILFGMFVLSFLGFSGYEAFFAAAAFALSSTAVVVKILKDRGEMDSLPGEIMIGWLIIQDLAVLPLIILLPTIGTWFATTTPMDATIFLDLLQKTLMAIGLVVGVLLLGKKIVPKLMAAIAGINSRELLLVAVFALALGLALVTQLIGLSLAIGAFLAGLLLAESSQNHAIISEIRPLRDIFALLFFVTLGLVLPAGFFFEHIGVIVVITCIMMLLKMVIVGGLTLYLGYHPKTSLFVSIGLIEVGEFAFVLAKLGLNERLISQYLYGIILSVTLLSVLIMPPLFVALPGVYTKLRNMLKRKLPRVYITLFQGTEHNADLNTLEYKDHVVICGYGRQGKYVGRALDMADIPYVVIEYNQHIAEKLRESGHEVVYGDPEDRDILDYAQVDTAKALVIALPDYHTQRMVIKHALHLNPAITIYCRAHQEEQVQDLKALGVHIVTQPEFEAAVTTVEKLLASFGQRSAVIEGKVSRLKIEHSLA